MCLFVFTSRHVLPLLFLLVDLKSSFITSHTHTVCVVLQSCRALPGYMHRHPALRTWCCEGGVPPPSPSLIPPTYTHSDSTAHSLTLLLTRGIEQSPGIHHGRFARPISIINSIQKYFIEDRKKIMNQLISNCGRILNTGLKIAAVFTHRSLNY